MKVHRKAKNSDRLFYSIEGDSVVEVVNKMNEVGIGVFKSAMMAEYWLKDDRLVDCTEAEFITVFNDAHAIVTMKKIV